jgi:hypothetical protein
MPKSDAERQRKRRAKLKSEALKPLLVRGDNGEFDERIRISKAIQKLALEGELSDEVIELIIKTCTTVIPTPERSKQLYIRKIVTEYLTDNGL